MALKITSAMHAQVHVLRGTLKKALRFNLFGGMSWCDREGRANESVIIPQVSTLSKPPF